MGGFKTIIQEPRLGSGEQGYYLNVYVDLMGTLRPKLFPREGLWWFDGQVFYLEVPTPTKNKDK